MKGVILNHTMNLKRKLYNIQEGALRNNGNELRLRLYSFALQNVQNKELIP